LLDLLKGTLIRIYRSEFFGLTFVVLACGTHLVLTVLALLDFSKAFYMVNHLLFLHKLE
jgi:hypothetical protein